MKVCNAPGSIEDPQLIVNPIPIQIMAGASHDISMSLKLLQEIVSGTKIVVDFYVDKSLIHCMRNITVLYYCMI